MPVIIVGAGPAGIGCAIQLSMAKREVILIDRSTPGGLLRSAHWVENFPLQDPVKGSVLADKLAYEIEKRNIPYVKDDIFRIDRAAPGFMLSGNEKKYRGEKVVIATGTVPLIPEIPGLAEIDPERTHYSVRDILTDNAPTTAVIGGGDAAFDQALSIKDSGGEVFIVMRGEPVASEHLIKAADDLNIKVYKNSGKLGLRKERHGISIYSHVELISDCDRILVACGRRPTQINMEKEVSNELYFAGDVANGIFRQAGIAWGDGIKVAMEILTNEKKSNIQN